MNTGTKAKPILMFHALMDRNRDSTIWMAVSRPMVTMSFVLIFFI